jgi:hypothetical protein
MSSNNLYDVFRLNGPHSPLATESPYDTSLTSCHISSGLGARPAALFFGESRGWGLVNYGSAQHPSTMLTDYVVPFD